MDCEAGDDVGVQGFDSVNALVFDERFMRKQG